MEPEILFPGRLAMRDVLAVVGAISLVVLALFPRDVGRPFWGVCVFTIADMRSAPTTGLTPGPFTPSTPPTQEDAGRRLAGGMGIAIDR